MGLEGYAAPPHSESSSGWGMEGQYSLSRSRPCVQSVHIFLQGLQTSVYFGHVCRLVVGAVFCESGWGYRGCEGPILCPRAVGQGGGDVESQAHLL